MKNRHDPVIPKYHQLARLLRAQIIKGRLQPGDQIPTEENLCREHGLSRGTVRQAIHVLEQEGLVQREQGRGTFVAVPKPKQQRAFFTLASFDEDMRRQGREPSTRVLVAERQAATPEVQERLQLRSGEEIFHIERLRLADNVPVAYEIRFLAIALCPELLQQDITHNSIHTLLIEHFHIPLVRTVHTVEVRLLSNFEASLLQTPPGSPAFYVDRLTYTTGPAGQRPAVWYQALYRGDEYHFRAEFESHQTLD